MHVRYSNLKQQLQDSDALWEELKCLVDTGDFTLLKLFEEDELSYGALEITHQTNHPQNYKV